MVFRFSDLEVEAEQSIFEIIPEFVCQILPNPETQIDLPLFSILEVLDLMTNYTESWRWKNLAASLSLAKSLPK